MTETPAGPSLILEARDLSARRGGRIVIAGVTLTIGAGAVFILRGPNGAGKTTLLRTLGGYSPPASGSLQAAPAATVFLGHADGVKAALTARENLSFWRDLYGAPAARVDDAIGALSISVFLTQRAATLSAGQRRRLALCRVLLSGRPLWLLDEPTAGMDAASVGAVLRLLAAHRQSGGAAIVATHEPLALVGATTLTLNEAA